MVSRARPQRERGVTLTELLVTLAVAGILSAVAAPSMRDLVAGIRARGAASDLYASVMRARSEAIKRNKEIQLAPGDSGQWQDGWRVVDPSDTDLKLDDHASVRGAAINGPASVTFQPNGRVKGGGDAKFDVSVSGNNEHRCIRIGLSGMPTQINGACP